MQYNEQLKPMVINYQNSLNKWLKQCSDFLDKSNFQELIIIFPDSPKLNINNSTDKQEIDNSVQINPKVRQVLNTRLRKSVMQGASFILNKNATKLKQSEPISSTFSHIKITSKTYANAAEDYLTIFSKNALFALAEYEKKAEEFMTYTVIENSQSSNKQYHQLQLLTNIQKQLNEELQKYFNTNK